MIKLSSDLSFFGLIENGGLRLCFELRWMVAVAGLRGGDEFECVKDIGERKEDDDRYHELG